jgi:hypothetical protein
MSDDEGFTITFGSDEDDTAADWESVDVEKLSIVSPASTSSPCL